MEERVDVAEEDSDSLRLAGAHVNKLTVERGSLAR